MRNELVRSLIDRDVTLQSGASYFVRSPTVLEALNILASYSGALSGERVQSEVFFETLKSWLPFKLYSVFKQVGYPRKEVVDRVFDMVNEGVPDLKNAWEEQRNEESSDISKKRVVMEWDAVIAEYMSAYGMTLKEALQEPWNGFLLLSKRVDMVNARQTLRILEASGIPNIRDDKERSEAVDKLVLRSGGRVETKEERRERLLAKQQDQLDIVARQFAAVGAFSGKPPPPGEA